MNKKFEITWSIENGIWSLVFLSMIGLGITMSKFANPVTRSSDLEYQIRSEFHHSLKGIPQEDRVSW